ncbi:MAG TPA: DUF1223 domain-containing protein [Kofleriaceae bacterium]|nr:DUF1223 domain-containing protein [Kofleriaceae bacterium]
MRAAFSAAFLVAALAACAPAYGDNQRVVLVELFTSQGCSSCPSADEHLAELGREEGIVALAFHVDYWDDLGWKDPFSSEAWTGRQRQYARALGEGGRIYTPQLVVNGRAHVVGSDRRGAAAAIRRAREAAARRVDVTASARLDAEAGRVRVAATARGAGSGQVWAALVESGLRTEVSRGENSGRHLSNDFVVRRLERVVDGEASLRVARAWRREHLAVVVFVQDPGDLQVLAAVRTSID